MELPLELWLEVLRQVENLSFKSPHDRLVIHQNFRLVCKAFRGLADGFVFKNVFVTNTQRSVSDLNQLTSKFGHHVRELTICINPHERISQQICDDYITSSPSFCSQKLRFDYHAYCEAYTQQVGASLSVEQLQGMLGGFLARAPRVKKIALFGSYTFRKGKNPDPRQLMRRHLATCRQREVCNILDLIHERHNRAQYFQWEKENCTRSSNNLLIHLYSATSANNITLTELTMDHAAYSRSSLNLGIFQTESIAFESMCRTMKHLRVLETCIEEQGSDFLRRKPMEPSRGNTTRALHCATDLRRLKLRFPIECTTDTFDLVFSNWRLPKLRVLSFWRASGVRCQCLVDLLKNTESLRTLSIARVRLIEGTWGELLEFIRDKTIIREFSLEHILSDPHSSYLQRSNDRLVANFLRRQGKNPLTSFGFRWHKCLEELKSYQHNHPMLPSKKRRSIGSLGS